MSNALNDHPVLRFDGGDADPLEYAASQLRVEDSPSLRLGTNDFSVVVVARWTNDAMVDAAVGNGGLIVYYGGYGSLLQKAEATGPYRGISLFANYPLGNPNFPSVRRFAAQLEFGVSFVLSYSTNLNDDVYRVYSARRFEHEKLEVRINGNPEGIAQVTPNVNADAVGQPLLLGGSKGAPFRGDIAEVVIVNGSVSPNDLHRLELSMKAKYAL